jgi:hypothetical protein
VGDRHQSSSDEPIRAIIAVRSDVSGNGEEPLVMPIGSCGQSPLSDVVEVKKPRNATTILHVPGFQKCLFRWADHIPIGQDDIDRRNYAVTVHGAF